VHHARKQRTLPDVCGLEWGTINLKAIYLYWYNVVRE
jgi:hypothetical protein